MMRNLDTITAVIMRRAVYCMALALWGCATPPQPAQKAPPPPVAAPSPPESVPSPPAKPTEAVRPPAEIPPPSLARAATWDDLPGWREEDHALAWTALLASCSAMKDRPEWRTPCTVAAQLTNPDAAAVRRYFETYFTPYRLSNTDGTQTGLVTGYYEPLLHGSRKPSRRYRFPVYGVPDDLLIVDLGNVYPQLKGMRLRGRIDGRRVVPYYDRAQIDNGAPALRGKELAWVEDPIDLFFLQIQGSGRIRLDNGQMVRVGYADQNGYPYRSIGRWLVERGELPIEKASMQGIKDWARTHPEQLKDLLNYNASYVFFRELPGDLPGPIGAQGVPLTAGRSVAVDARYVPLGAPVYLATTRPNSTVPLNRLMMAQDTGGAIRGPVRADFFWGYGDEAGRQAGRMKQELRMWLLLPIGMSPPAAPE
jgi:membrane-bound lytic murein transglycosylase A